MAVMAEKLVLFGLQPKLLILRLQLQETTTLVQKVEKAELPD